VMAMAPRHQEVRGGGGEDGGRPARHGQGEGRGVCGNDAGWAAIACEIMLRRHGVVMGRLVMELLALVDSGRTPLSVPLARLGMWNAYACAVASFHLRFAQQRTPLPGSGRGTWRVETNCCPESNACQYRKFGPNQNRSLNA